MGHRCPRPGCDRTVPEHLLACRHDWFALPADIRSRVSSAWATRQRTGDPTEHRAALVAALHAWGGKVGSSG